MNKSIAIRVDILLIDIPRQGLHSWTEVKHTPPYTPITTEPEFDSINIGHGWSWHLLLPWSSSTRRSTEPPRRWHLFIWTPQLEVLCEAPQGLSQRSKHFIMWLITVFQ